MEKFDSTAEEKNTTTAISQFLSFLLLRNKKINDAYPKMVLARTKHEPYQYEGVRIVDLAEWLSNRSSQ